MLRIGPPCPAVILLQRQFGDSRRKLTRTGDVVNTPNHVAIATRPLRAFLDMARTARRNFSRYDKSASGNISMREHRGTWHDEKAESRR